MLLGLGAAARVPVGLIPLFAALLCRWPVRWPPTYRGRRSLRFIPLGIGVAIPIVVTMVYNIARFGDPTEFGYNLVLNAAGQSVLTEPWYQDGVKTR